MKSWGDGKERQKSKKRPSASFMHRKRLESAFRQEELKGWERIDGFPINATPEARADFAFLTLCKANPFLQTRSFYTRKIIDWTLTSGLLPEDHPRLSRALRLFEEKKDKIPLESRDIGSFESHKTLYETVKPFEEEVFIPPERLRRLNEDHVPKGDADILWETQKACLIHIKTERAAIAYGDQTKWCTAYTDAPNHFDYYREYLFVLWTSENKRVQIHILFRQFRNEQDESVDPVELFEENPGLSDVLSGLWKIFVETTADAELLSLCLDIPEWKKRIDKEMLTKIFTGPLPLEKKVDFLLYLGKVPESAYAISSSTISPEMIDPLIAAMRPSQLETFIRRCGDCAAFMGRIRREHLEKIFNDPNYPVRAKHHLAREIEQVPFFSGKVSLADLPCLVAFKTSSTIKKAQSPV